MEDNNNIDPSTTSTGNYLIPDTIDPKLPYIELEPENELNFVESKKLIDLVFYTFYFILFSWFD